MASSGSSRLRDLRERVRRDSRGLARVARRLRFIAAGAFVITLLVTATARISPAADPVAAVRDLASDPDFRVRATAAFYLGKAHPPGAREALERALSDAHPSVRTAAAAALGTLGDAAAIGALEKQKAKEPSASAKAQMQSSIDTLKKSVAVMHGARVVVKLGSMHNNTSLRGDALGVVLGVAARTRAAAVPGLVLTEDEAVMREAIHRKIPVVILDGSLIGLTEGRDKGNVTYRAQVEFSVRRDQALRGTLRGAATSYDSLQALGDHARVVALQNDAVDGAVQSALKGADTGIALVVK